MTTTDLLLSAGRGPQECAWAVARLATRLESAAARHSLRTRRVSAVPGDRPGTYRSVVVRIAGAGAAELAAAWTGTLCWQAPSPYRPGHARKNWYVTARPVPAAPAVVPAFAEADVDVVGCRTGGPGGQHRNKASTAARATHRPSGTVVVVDTERQFTLNRRLALDLLRRRLADHAEAATRSATTARWRLHDDLVRGDPIRTERPDARTVTAPRPPRKRSV
ncbi:peptide chain release factor H [Spirilliplanes yamanashiensis]|uniref:Peptide chain release factor-like protein n=1 Tax=Spirilliplanes yamanashiensis TaxID=42233 RepID=A0A8J3Y432_9ACTN|nr:peptide chain release factor H [Spirilliplanes yamanashiensis]MDP9820065.1 peptide chain release factor [Spirilliplanes yamanashiensis]GIJ01114.1 peptide chain release factor-like protein [Spirilliplanes yamanashiensis]